MAATELPLARRLVALGISKTTSAQAQDSNWALAYSGGPDSTALLLLLLPLCPKLTVFIVDHGLRQASAAEAEFAARLASSLGAIPHILKWEGEKPATGIMAAARHARYERLLMASRERGIDCLFLAHHADDQAETLRLRAQAHSGWRGMAGMPWLSVRGGIKLVRPLLDLPKAALEDICTQAGVSFIRDPSNSNPRYTRARLRQQPAPPPPSTAAQRQAELHELAAQGGKSYLLKPGYAELLSSTPGEGLLRLLLSYVGQANYPPAPPALTRALEKLQRGQGFTLAGCVLARARDRFIVAREAAAMPVLENVQVSSHMWYDKRWLVSAHGQGPLSLAPLGERAWRSSPAADLLAAMPAAARRSWPAWGLREDLVGGVKGEKRGEGAVIALAQPLLYNAPLQDVFVPSATANNPFPEVF